MMAMTEWVSGSQIARKVTHSGQNTFAVTIGSSIKLS